MVTEPQPEFRPFSFRTLAIIVLLLAMHLPFMLSDPDTEVTVMSRGPWTDEGLNTVQVRNFVNHGRLAFDECDNLIKTPFFAAVLLPFYKVLGTDLWVGRLAVLLSVLTMLWLLLAWRPTRTFGIVFAMLGLMQFHLFHYSHYSMAEMMGVAVLLSGILMLRHAHASGQRGWYGAATLLFGMAFLCKVTFAYALLLPFMARFFLFLSERTHHRNSIFGLTIDMGIMGVVAASVVGGFYYLWYDRFRDIFWLVRENQGHDRFDMNTAWERLQFNWEHFISVEGFAPLLILLLLGLLVILRTALHDRGDRATLFALLAWLLLEMHRLLLVNPPTRYLIPLFASMMAVTAFGLTRWKDAPGRRWAIVLLIIGFTGFNISHYRDSLSRRTFVMQDISKYLASHDLKDKRILGVWATGLADRSRAYTLPVWNGFMNHVDPIGSHHPRVVITEHDEAECDRAFSGQGIDLHSLADSSRTFGIWRYQVNLFWLPE